MKRFLFCLFVLLATVSVAHAQLTFYLVDNFEDGTLSKWYVFDNVKAAVIDNPLKDQKDSIGDACGDKSLKIVGKANSWYAGGIGMILDVDGADYSRFIIDVAGSKAKGKLKIELFEKGTGAGTEETKWTVDLPVLGEGFTRYSIPFTSFSMEDPKTVVFHGKNGGKITKLQIICVANSEKGDADVALDNIIFTF